MVRKFNKKLSKTQTEGEAWDIMKAAEESKHIKKPVAAKPVEIKKDEDTEQ